MSTKNLSLIIQGILTLVLIVGMVWLVASPVASDEVTKAALAILGAATGFIFGKGLPTNGDTKK